MGRPTTFGTLALPETKIVTLDPGATLVPPTGLWFTTVPDGWVDVGSVLTTTWKPSFCSTDWAEFSCLPSTLGTVTGAAPVETYSVTVVFAATTLPSAGLDLMTRPLATLELGWLISAGTRCWARI